MFKKVYLIVLYIDILYGKKNADFPPTGKGMNGKTAGAKRRRTQTSVAESGGGKKSRATERGMDLQESSSGVRL